MKRLIERLMPRRIAAQSATVVIGSVLLIHIAITSHFRLLDGHGEAKRREFVHVGTIIRLVAGTPHGPDRDRLVADLAKTFPRIGITLGHEAPAPMIGELAEELSDRPPPPGGGGPDHGLFGPPFDSLDPAVRVVEIDPIDDRPRSPLVSPFSPSRIGALRRYAIGLDGGDWLGISDPSGSPPGFGLGPFGASIVFALLASGLLALWAARALVGPLRALAAAARDFDITEDAEPLPKRGPEEVRVAAAAFDAMRRRIRSLVEDRTRMLAAMGHDLRTPITRLRLRSEFVGDEALRDEIQRDLTVMGEMIDGALTYLAEGRHSEKPSLVDLPATIETLCDTWADLGRDITYIGPDHLPAVVRPVAMSRALGNLIDNALRYGTRCTVRLKPVAGGGATIEVEDDGPGIASADREAMLRPFVRGDASRNMDRQMGFGLGLAVVKSVIDGHGGRLELADAVPHGLLVRIELPPTRMASSGE